ncbi:hypothetical protein KBZ18_00410 [Synechococcus sp. Cruz-9H2]|nr:hypothetical protein [Synechococcus sp. Cruz-9H2]MCP9842549.1 hypothetical protein [Synechococcus sp. Edmonson 11F2]MCP9854347.1 hypothetical protein [Synechococcus sp. Cruz-9C9]MCP9861957.1 hypothetical protein [Synechococcus sp. Cruz-7E5]MCP9868859.1 hypothetical protein [Synechococcus sp. Cruz-7B9]
MTLHDVFRPVPLPSAPAAAMRSGSPQDWPPTSRELAEELQRLLAIDGRDWHAHKGHKPRRAAEQLAAALVHLLAEDSPPHRLEGDAQERAIELVEHGLAWLKGDLRDPGCPSHGH